MKIEKNEPPREFKVGPKQAITIRDCAHIWLEPDEQVTFKTESGGEYDVARKDWGFYATPSLNGRLLDFGLKGCLVKNKVTKRLFVMLVEEGKEALFEKYVEEENLEVTAWLTD